MRASEVLKLVEDFEEYEQKEIMGVYSEEEKREAELAYWAFFDYCRHSGIIWDLD
jgi:hypothetical protein